MGSRDPASTTDIVFEDGYVVGQAFSQLIMASAAEGRHGAKVEATNVGSGRRGAQVLAGFGNTIRPELIVSAPTCPNRHLLLAFVCDDCHSNL